MPLFSSLRRSKRGREESGSDKEKMDDSETLKITLVEVVHKKSDSKVLYVLDKNTFEVTQVLSDIPLSDGDIVVKIGGVDLKGDTFWVDLRGKPYEVFSNAMERTRRKVVLLVVKRNSDPKCLQPSFKLPVRMQILIYCLECGKIVEGNAGYFRSVSHIFSCTGIEVDPEPQPQPEEEEEGEMEIVIKPSPKRMSFLVPTAKLSITLREMLWRWKDFWPPKYTKKKVVTIEFIKNVLANSGIAIVECNRDLDSVKYELYQSVITALRKRFEHRLEAIQKARGLAKAGLDEDEIMFTLERTPDLIDMNCYQDPNQPDSQGSDFSIRSSQLSNIEEEFPIPDPDPEPQQESTSKSRKSFDQYTDQYKREKIQMINQAVHDYCLTNGIEFNVVICQLGHQNNYVSNRKLAKTFKEIGKGNFNLPLEMPMDEAMYVKSRFLKTQRKYTDYRLFHKKYFVAPTYNNLSKAIHELIPPKIPIRNGYRLELRTVAEETLMRFPDNVSQSIEL